MKNLLLLLWILFFVNTNLFSQDAHWTQNLVPSEVNPALTGLIKEKQTTELFAIARRQGELFLPANNYNNLLLAFNSRICLGNKNFLGYGGSLSLDESGKSVYTKTQISATGSYSRHLFDNQNQSLYLSAGAKIGLVQRKIDFSKLSWSEQFDYIDFNPLLPTGEPNLPLDLNFSRTSLDINTGLSLAFFNTFRTQSVFQGIVGGVALNHVGGLLQPKLFNTSLLLKGDTLTPNRWLLHIKTVWSPNELFTLTPSFIAQEQANAWEINFGFITQFSPKSMNNIKVGVFSRWNNFVQGWGTDALSLLLGYGTRNLDIIFTYDINLSNSNAKPNGALEFGSIYHFGNPNKNECFDCPDFY